MAEHRKEIIDVEKWIDTYGDLLFSYAIVRIKDESIAADLVQNTFLAALTATGSFQGKSSLKTWLLGILKHKIMDYYRVKQKESVLQDTELDSIGPGDFTTEGKWVEKPKAWHHSPEEVLENNEAQKMLWDCINALPERMRLLFMLREIDGESTETICERMNLSISNFSVLLYRTRHKLRKEFEIRGVSSLQAL